jgi:predicted amidohydrolase YtcJ
MFDILIKNARIVDGNGSPSFEGSVGIKGEKIAAVGDLSESQAVVVIDAKSLAVSPGFIDIHAHSEFTLLADRRGEGKVMQGGNDRGKRELRAFSRASLRRLFREEKGRLGGSRSGAFMARP